MNRAKSGRCIVLSATIIGVVVVAAVGTIDC